MSSVFRRNRSHTKRLPASSGATARMVERTERDLSVSGLTKEDLDLLRMVFRRYPGVREVRLYGSRARGGGPGQFRH